MSMDSFLNLCFDFKGYIALSTIPELIKVSLVSAHFEPNVFIKYIF